MPQSNSILSLCELTDENINEINVEDKKIVKNGIVKRIKIINAVLTYSRTTCPKCRTETLIKNGYTMHHIRLATISGPETYMYLKKQRYQCKTCHLTCGVHTPIVKPNHSLATNIKAKVVEQARLSHFVISIAKVLNISPSSAERLLYSNNPEPYRVKNLGTHMNWDEFRSVNKGFSFICIDAEGHSIIKVLDTRLSKDICDYFENRYELSERQAVKTIVMDLNASYQSFVHRLFPNAQIVVDRFHIVQLVNRAFDNVRTSVLKGIQDKKSRPYKALKTNWRLFHLAQDKIDDTNTKYICGINEYMTQQNLIDLGLNESSTLKKVYETAHAIQQAIHNRDGESLTSILKNYIPMGNAMDTAISTLKKNRSSVVASCSSAFSNGAIEGINRKIKTLKRACYGFTNMSHFRTRILLIVK